MFFQETTPDTSGYMIAGYAVAFIVMAIYVASLYLRARNLNQDMTMLEEMDKSATPAQAASPHQSMKSPAKPTGNPSTKMITKNKTRKNY